MTKIVEYNTGNADLEIDTNLEEKSSLVSWGVTHITPRGVWVNSDSNGNNYDENYTLLDSPEQVDALVAELVEAKKEVWGIL